ncbi:MAG: uroporphyrinogen decarboxylase [Gammaproteobacteria bacterium]|nr:uroporphyrinogen decarboxylase [Gammaproteobacteria bacterium]
MLKNDRLLKALRREPVDQTPVWIMRQAGRYLPEYRALRAQAHNFLEFCQNPELCMLAALQPIARFNLDAAILFSDILTVPHALGMDLQFLEGEGPQFATPLRHASQIDSLKKIDVSVELKYVMQAVRQTRQALNGSIPLIGFAGSPWTLAAYMIEGRGSKEFSKARQCLYHDPKTLHRLLALLTDTLIDYLRAQVEAGADVIMLFDSWGGLLTSEAYSEFSLPYMSKIFEALPKVPSILFTKGGGLWLTEMAHSGAHALGLDWTMDLQKAAHAVGHHVALQGNLDPAALYGDSASIQHKVKTILDVYGQKPGHIFNLGHGIYPDIDPEKVQVMVDAIRQYRKFKP